MPSHAAFVLILMAIAMSSQGQQDPNAAPRPLPTVEAPGEVRLPNGKLQIDEILKSDRDRSVQDVKQLIETAQALQKDLEQKESPHVLSVADIRKTEEIEKLAKRIRGRIRHD